MRNFTNERANELTKLDPNSRLLVETRLNKVFSTSS